MSIQKGVGKRDLIVGYSKACGVRKDNVNKNIGIKSPSGGGAGGGNKCMSLEPMPTIKSISLNKISEPHRMFDVYIPNAG